MSKGGGKTVETKQNTQPWTEQQPYLKDLFSKAQTQYNAPQTSGMTTNLQNLITRRAIQGSELNADAADHLQSTMSGAYSNPYASGAMSDAMDMARSKINAQ